METKEEGEVPEERPTSPIQVLQHLSEGAVRVAGEALQSVYLGSPKNIRPLGSGHRRSQSEVVTSVNRHDNNLQKWKSQMQRAFRLGNNSQEKIGCSSFNPEILANQKRQWYQLHSKSLDHKKYKESTSLFEHFIIAGLHPDANLEVVEGAFARRKKWELEMNKPDMIDLQMLQCRRPTVPSLEPQILFTYPPGKRLDARLKDLAAFCFPEGVKACMLERTPSLSELNELVYGQEHLSRDDSSFIFSLKVADNTTLYGVCLHVQEFVQRPPALLGASSPFSQSSRGCSRFLVSAPRCYCILTRLPFFELHFEMLNSIISQERLNRITQFVSEMTFSDYDLSVYKSNDEMNKHIASPLRECDTDWTASAIPIESAIAITAAAAGIISDDEVPSSSSRCEPQALETFTASEASDLSQATGIYKNDQKNLNHFDDSSSEASENCADGSQRLYGVYDNGPTPAFGEYVQFKSRTLQCLKSSESLFSPVKSWGLEDEDDLTFFSHKKDSGDYAMMEWARENKNDLLQIVCAYHGMPPPRRGGKIVFQPLDHLQAIEYWRPPLSALSLNEKCLSLKMQYPFEAAEVTLTLATAEEAVALSIWTTATICQVLSLERVLALITGVLLEKQVVVVCPNLGVLSAIVLSIIPLIRPFEWQSLFLPILPGTMLDFLDAPVPFIVGIQHKPEDLKMKTSSLVHVNVVKDQVKMCYLPALPRQKELISELGPIHASLSSERHIARRHPVYKCNEMQAEASAQFVAVMRRYLESLCSDLRSHTITSVQSNNDRVSILLRDSFIDSFPSRDQPFIKLLVDTQLFTVLSDHRISSYENGYH